MLPEGRRALPLVALLLCAASVLVDDTGRVGMRAVLYALATGTGVVTLRRARAYDGPALGAFWVLTASCALYATSNALRALVPTSAAGEVVNGAASVALLLAGVVFVRRIRPGHGPRIALDGLIVGLVAALGLREIAAASDRAVAGSLPSMMMVVGLVGVSLWLRAIATDPSGAVRAFALAAGLAMPGTVLISLGDLGAARPLWVDAWTLASTVVLVHALCHPDLAGVRAERVPAFRRVTLASVLLMLLALAAAPVLMWARAVRDAPPDVGLALGLSVLTVLWVARFSLMLIDRDAHRDRLDRELATDPLTRVASRRRFTDHLDALLDDPDPEVPLAVLMADLDDFKAINDVHGHHVGDETLVAVATLLRDVVGSRGLVARLSGDEFAVALHTADPVAVQREVCSALGRVVVRAEPLVEVTASVGMALADPDEPSSQQLLERADRSMYARKRARALVVEQQPGVALERSRP